MNINNIFSNLGDVGVAIAASLLVAAMDEFGIGIFVILAIAVIILPRIWKIVPVIAIVLIVQLPSYYWSDLATSLWIGAGSNLVWEIALWAILTKVTGLEFPKKAPGMLNWAVAAVSFWLLVNDLALPVAILISIVLGTIATAAFVMKKKSSSGASTAGSDDDYDPFA